MTITDFQRKKLLHLFHTFFGEDKLHLAIG